MTLHADPTSLLKQNRLTAIFDMTFDI